MDQVRIILSEKAYTHEEKLACLDGGFCHRGQRASSRHLTAWSLARGTGITFEAVKAFAKTLLSRIHVEALITGNYSTQVRPLCGSTLECNACPTHGEEGWGCMAHSLAPDDQVQSCFHHLFTSVSTVLCLGCLTHYGPC